MLIGMFEPAGIYPHNTKSLFSQLYSHHKDIKMFSI